MDALLQSETAEFCLRLGIATVLGFIIGLERSLRSKEAGPRTHCIMACAAALFMILSKYAFLDQISPGEGGGVDGTMIACQIVNGVTFLGAGIIFKSKQRMVTGLTTATGIWYSAAVGMACGSGLKTVAIFSTLFVVLLQYFFHRLKIGGSSLVVQEVQITLLNTPKIWRIFRRHQRRYGIEIISAKIDSLPKNYLSLTLQVRMSKLLSFDDAMHLLDQHPEIKGIST